MSAVSRPSLREARRIALELGASVETDGGEWVFRAPGLRTIRAHFDAKQTNGALHVWLKRLRARAEAGS